MMRRLLIVWAGIALALWIGFAPPAGAVQIREIRIVNLGPGPLTPESVLPLLSLREGEPFNRAAVISDTQRLQATGRFSQVDVVAEPLDDSKDVALVLAIRNKPRLARLTVDGSTRLSNRRIAELLDLKLGDPVDDGNLAAGARKIENEFLKNYHPHARVNWTLRTDEETGRADVDIRIREGPKGLVTEIVLRGLDRKLEKEIRSVLRQTVYQVFNPWHWVSGAGRFDPDFAESEALILRRALLDRGFLDAVVEGPKVELEQERIRMIFDVRPGDPYVLRRVTLTGHTLFDEETLRQVHGLRPGESASLARMDDAASALQDYYMNRGYYGTRVRRTIEADARTRFVDLDFRIEEGRLSRMRDLRIEGNRVTRDTVIRRELVIASGDQFDQSRIQTSERRLRNLGYFSDVRSTMAETGIQDTYDLVFQVEEGQMGLASAGIGFTSIESISGYVELSHGNFALGEWPPYGDGQKIRLRAQVGSRSNTFETEFIEPWFLERQLSLAINLFRSEARYLSSDYNQRNTGGRVSLTRALDAFWRVSLEYGLQNIEIFDVSERASPAIREEEGDRMKSALTLALTRDTRRMEFRGAPPSGGNFLRLSGGYAGGPLGGDTDLYELSLQGSQFISLGWRQILTLRARAGVVEAIPGEDRVPLFDRLFLGGPTNLRGFPFRGVGPRDENRSPIGGRSMAFASAEYSVPLVPNIRGALFYDLGMVWAEAYGFDSDLNSSYGLGVRLDIPMLPIRLDYAWPLETDEFNARRNGRFSFWIGHSF